MNPSLLLRLTIAASIGAMACAVGALVGLAWSAHPHWWMPTLVAATEFLAAATAILALAARAGRRSPSAE